MNWAVRSRGNAFAVPTATDGTVTQPATNTLLSWSIVGSAKM